MNEKILITGATGGIGKALVKKFLSLDGTILATWTNTEKYRLGYHRIFTARRDFAWGYKKYLLSKKNSSF